MSVPAFDSIKNATRRIRRVEWTGFAVLSVLSLAISLLSFAATAGQL